MCSLVTEVHQSQRRQSRRTTRNGSPLSGAAANQRTAASLHPGRSPFPARFASRLKEYLIDRTLSLQILILSTTQLRDDRHRLSHSLQCMRLVADPNLQNVCPINCACLTPTIFKLNPPRNSTLFSATPETYWSHFEEISKYNVHLNVFERLWEAWYAFMQNDVLATGIMSFVMHEVVYFGRSLPWIIIDTFGLFRQYKIQDVSIAIECLSALQIANSPCLVQNKIPTLKEQWECARLVLLSHFTVELPQIW